MNDLIERTAALNLEPGQVDEIAQTAHAALRTHERCQGDYWRDEWCMLSLTDKNEMRAKVIERLEARSNPLPEHPSHFTLINGCADRLFAAIVGALDPRR